MNNRLTELKQKAYVIKDGEFCFDGGEVEILDVNLFAELIVAECISTLNKRFMGDLNREDMEVRRCIEDVKKHFGVEE